MTVSPRTTERKHVLAAYRNGAVRVTSVISDDHGRLEWASATVSGHRGTHLVDFGRLLGWKCMDRQGAACPDEAPCRHIQAVEGVVARPPQGWEPPPPGWTPADDQSLWTE